ncbi:Lysine transporter LysE [Pseudomonas marincola]|uniref:Lysine transporter LysE n=1 Tax=Pseudomonas marincola TaxID=437900 RepID=A0A1I7CZS8_9PSED|nr:MULTISPECIES: LysE family transporter [Pseudomonas]NRH29790.1 LysE family translocator [Pseudomonas sp. MS19]OEO23884.1 lysine transporter LysE [Pseudomonas sp. J237]CAE6903148.1 Lysine transporter LysE [Pseudomonas marincola]SFU04925.1 Threonine/homoserine/homoserine lactone efflux protein [Pseudomonas marincola]
MALHVWLIYLAAVTGLSLTPGPNGLLALTHGALYGHRRTLWTISGGVIGFVALMALSMFGIGALLNASANALIILKWIGGAYLIWLGIGLWRAPAINLQAPQGQALKSSNALFRQGLFSAVSNPKVILFFGAFLPQFIQPNEDLLLQFAVMALTFAVVEGCIEYVLAHAAHRIRPWLQRRGKAFNRCCGGLFAAMGAALPLTR